MTHPQKNSDVDVRKSNGGSEIRFQTLFEQSADAYLILDGNIFVDCNQATVKMLKARTKEEVLSTHPSQLSPEFQPDGRPSAEKANEMIQIALDKGSNRFEWMHRKVDGEDFMVEVLLTPIPLGDRTIIHTVWRDISERVKARELLEASEKTYRGIFNSLSEAIYVQDQEGRFLDVNDGVLQIYGHPREFFMGKTPEVVSAPDKNDMNAVFAAFGQAFEGKPQKFEFWGLRKNGEIFPKEVRLYPGEFFGQKVVIASGVDITERKKLEREVREAFERRGYQVQVSTEISQELASAVETGDLFERVVILTKERLGYYHTQLLRYDAAQDAVVLVNGYGETGKKMLADGHKLPMGSGLIGAAAATGKSLLRSTLQDDPDWKPNPLLPDTKGEIAVPIKLQGKTLGVLDAQSDRAGSLTEDDRLLLEGLCGQIAVAIEQTRLRQEMAERLEEINRLYRAMSREGWETYRRTAEMPKGFVFDQAGVREVDEADLSGGLFERIPMAAPGGEVVGSLSVANDPQNPVSAEDRIFLMQVSEQVALALESARLAAQTQSALTQSEKLFEASRRLTQAADLQELTAVTVEAINIPAINRAIMAAFTYNAEEQLEGLDIIANWWNGTGMEATAIGTHYTAEVVRMIPMFVTPSPLFFDDGFADERVDPVTMNLVKRLNLRAVAVLPLHVGASQIGVLMLEGEEPHNFTDEEKRLFVALGPQIATVLENRRQFERAQKQAEREAMLNVINQKIQGATSVEAVLQIAARELGHALGAPMTVAQLSLKDTSA
ncbi:MAG: hypothetical protein KPEEDBHJ_00819 [Anaerolineales bacterium]|nr:hypothetical protein [Anaerolineales bacterium]